MKTYSWLNIIISSTSTFRNNYIEIYF